MDCNTAILPYCHTCRVALLALEFLDESLGFPLGQPPVVPAQLAHYVPHVLQRQSDIKCVSKLMSGSDAVVRMIKTEVVQICHQMADR